MKKEAIESKPKRKYVKKAASWNLAKECLARANRAANQPNKLKRTKKESVMKLKVDKKAAKAEKEAKKAVMDAEKEAINVIKRNCKIRAKELSKIVDDAEKQNLIAKLIKLGYSFDLNDPNKLTVMVTVGCTIVPKMKKLKVGAKAVAVDAKKPICEKKTIIEKTNPSQPDDLLVEAVEPTECQDHPTEIPIGDTFSDDVNLPLEPTDAELDQIECEEDEDSNMEDEDLINYRKEFFNNLDEDDDNSNL